MLRLTPHPPAPGAEAARIKAMLEPFAQPVQSPVRDQIAGLRDQRDAGTLSNGDFAIQVAELLGASELPRLI